MKRLKKIIFIILISIIFVIICIYAIISYNLRPMYSSNGRYVAKTHLCLRVTIDCKLKYFAQTTISEVGKQNSEYQLDDRYKAVDWGRGITWDKNENRLWIYDDRVAIHCYSMKNGNWEYSKYFRKLQDGKEVLGNKEGEVITNLEEVFPKSFNKLIHNMRRVKGVLW